MAYSPGEKRGPGKLLDFQVSLPLDVYRTKQRRQEACVDEHIDRDKTQTLQGCIQEVEAGRGDAAGV